MATNGILSEYLREAEKADSAKRASKKTRPVEGFPFWPHEMVRNTIIVLIFTGLTMYLAAFMPYFLESPANPAGQPLIILPDWYLLWSYGLLKIADDFTILGFALPMPFIGLDNGFELNPAAWTPMNAKVVGLLLNAVVMVPLIILPFIHRGVSRRPVESPAWAAVGVAYIMVLLMQSVYAINNVVWAEWPITAKEYGVWMRPYITVFQLDLLSWMTNLLPVIFALLTYIPLKLIQKQHGYEAKLNYSYYKVR